MRNQWGYGERERVHQGVSETWRIGEERNGIVVNFAVNYMLRLIL